MPGLSQRVNDSTSDDNNDSNSNNQNQLVGNGMLPCHSFSGSSVSNNRFWSKQRDDVSFNQLQKFWCDLTLQARHKLLRIDKQTFLEHARKNMYCSRCNGLLLEGFLQIVMYGKSLQQDAAGHYGVRAANTQNDGDLCMDNGFQDDVLDPSIHPWGGLTTARDGTLTLLDCYLCSKSLKGLQNVFDSARAREKERKLLYPDACGGGGRGWISQGQSGYGRGHVTRETCALHTARLSVETLLDFWSALGDETRQSLLRMKEEDFIERLMYRFDSKRFCRDCRRNVIREFKELKELKRMRRETRCTSWFCVADTAFQYEVSCDMVQADWNQTFVDALESYHHFEWAIGTGEGKSDIMEFEDVGLSGKVEASGLDLSGLSACYITLRAWKMDRRCNELCVKAHALRGQQCVHCRLVVGDGYLTITRGESIRSFFEHAEEAEEEEDDDSLDKDGNELDGECSRPQKHAKSPELAREFLLDAATVIFKEQVEKAFREGTARQNAHSIFVCLALKLLEERLHVACKEIITLEKQMKLLEEEEKEKREEEERKERRRIKEKEKKLRRKERLREKDNKDNKCAESNLDGSKDTTPCVNDAASVEGSRDSVSETGEASPASPLSFEIQDDKLLTVDFYSSMENLSEDSPDGEFGNTRDWNTSYQRDYITYSHRKLRNEPQQGLNLKWSDGKNSASSSENGVIVSKYESRYQADSVECTRSINGFNKQLKTNITKSHFRNGGPKLSEKCRCTNNRTGDRYDSHICNCNHYNEYRPRSLLHITRVVREPKYDVSKPYYRGRYSQVDFARETNGRLKSKGNSGNPANIKQVWEPLDSQRKCVQSNSNSDVKSTTKTETSEPDLLPASGATYSDEVRHISVQANHDSDLTDIIRSSSENCRETTKEFHAVTKSKIYSKEAVAEDGELCSMTKSPHETPDSSISSSGNCSSCLSEGNSHASSSNLLNTESSTTSDSEESTQNSEGRKKSNFNENKFTECSTVVDENARLQDNKSHGPAPTKTYFPSEVAPHCESGRADVSTGGQPLSMLPQMNNHSIHYPVFHAPAMSYYHQPPISWPAGPTNGLMSFPNPNPYLYANTFGYDLNGNARFLQYGTLQQMAPPLLNPAHVPVFPQVSQANGVSAKEHAKVANLGEVKEVQHKTQNVASTDQQGRNVKPDKMDMETNCFSLFHFGGPAALSDGLKGDSISLSKGTTVDPSLNLPGNSLDGDHSCNMKDSIEEYNLFAAGNGIKFSFF